MAHQQDTTKETQTQAIEMAVADGPHWSPEINEYEVWLNGEVIGYASTDTAAWRIYHSELHYQKVHFQRCPEDYDIPVYANGKLEMVINMADDYGLDARG